MCIRDSAQPFRLEAAGAVERLFGIHVALDLGDGKGAETDGGDILRIQGFSVADQARRRMEADLPARHRGQLGDGGLPVAGLAQWLSVQFGRLVRADDPRARVLPCLLYTSRCV